ncbi:hypothetical protein HDZ31DRAFT_69724 [Schizophyllum fasciatum]
MYSFPEAGDSGEVRLSGVGDDPEARHYITSREDIINAAFLRPHRDSISPAQRTPVSFPARRLGHTTQDSSLSSNLTPQPPPASLPKSSREDAHTIGGLSNGPCMSLILSPHRHRPEEEDPKR